jgi:Divergent InlB B-repeat domain
MIDPVRVRPTFVVLVSILLGLLLVAGATAARQRQVRLTISITGHGGVRLSNGRQVGCGVASCKRTVLVRAGSRITLKAMPARLWAFSSWTGACRGTKPTCTLRVRRSTIVTEKLLPPGSTSANPIPLGDSLAFGDGWVFRVVSVSIDATAQLVATGGNTPPPPGAQYTMLNVTATYTGGGYSSFSGDAGGHRLSVIGSHNFAYGPCYQQLPPPPFDFYKDVYSGQTIGGNVCFRIATNDADSLALNSEFYDERTHSERTVWFALR